MYRNHVMENARRIVELRASSALDEVRRSLEGQERTPPALLEPFHDPRPAVRKLALSVHDLRSRFKERLLPEMEHLAWPECRPGSGSIEALALGR